MGKALDCMMILDSFSFDNTFLPPETKLEVGDVIDVTGFQGQAEGRYEVIDISCLEEGYTRVKVARPQGQPRGQAPTTQEQ